MGRQLHGSTTRQLAEGASWQRAPSGILASGNPGAPGKGDVAAVGVLAGANRLHHCVVNLSSNAIIVLQAANRRRGVVSTHRVWAGGQKSRRRRATAGPPHVGKVQRHPGAVLCQAATHLQLLVIAQQQMLLQLP